MSITESVLREQARTLYSDHHGWLQSWLRGKTGCSQQAADLAQDTFVRILRARSSRLIHEPRAYLSTIARGLLVDHFRRSEIERVYLDALALLPESEAPMPEQQLLILEALMQVDAVLDTLPAQARKAFLLSQLDGLTYAQIARELNVSLITVKRHMLRAFRACLELS